MDKEIYDLQIMNRLAIIGSGDLGQSIQHYAVNNGFDVVGFFDDFQKEEYINGVSVLGKLSDIEDSFNNNLFDTLICAIGYNHLKARQDVYNRFHNDCHIPFATIVDKSCHVDSSAHIGEGSVMFPGAFVDKSVELGENVLLNVCVTIAHDTKVKAHTFISPRVAIAGFSTIGSRCMIGINSTIIDNVKIGDDIRLGGGTLVIKDLEKPGLYVGSPAIWKKE